MSAISDTSPTSSALSLRRGDAVHALIAATRHLPREPDGRPADLAEVARQLTRLALRTELFPEADFPTDPTRTTTFYRLAEDPDGGHALYVSASLPGRKQLPHDHTTWAVIAGIRGLERNVVYQRHPAPEAGRYTLSEQVAVTVGPGDAVTLAPEDYHTTEIVGDTPALHLHFYGLSQERMVDRVKFDGPEGGVPTPVPVPTQIRHPVVSAQALRTWLQGAEPVAVLDVRDEAAYARGHLLQASNAPLGRLPWLAPMLLPALGTLIVVADEDEAQDQAHAAAARLVRQGYANVSVLRGGTRAWQAAGLALYQGVHVPGKALAELSRLSLSIPEVDVPTLRRWLAEGRPLRLLDVRPHEEYRRYSIPGSVNCPTGTLALSVPALALAPGEALVVHCAGRARSLIAAQTLLATGLPHPVHALRNGTMDWERHGGTLAVGQDQALALPATSSYPQRARADVVRLRAGVPYVSAQTVAAWLAESWRPVHRLDIREPDEFEAGHLPGWRNTPGGQLLHTLDAQVAARNARIVLADWDGVRAPYIAAWLAAWARHDVALLRPDPRALLQSGADFAPLRRVNDQAAPWIGPAALASALAAGNAAVFDVGRSTHYQDWHIAGARHATLGSLRAWLAQGRDAGLRIVLSAEDSAHAQSLAAELRDAGHADVLALLGGNRRWRREGRPGESEGASLPGTEDAWRGPHTLRDADARAAAFADYVAWEADLPRQLADAGDDDYDPARAPAAPALPGAGTGDRHALA